MSKYILHACVIFFCIVVGVGLVAEIDNKNNLEEEVSSLEDSIANGEEIDDGNMENVRVEKEDTSNLISNINATLATFVVKGLNSVLKIMVNAVSSITN